MCIPILRGELGIVELGVEQLLASGLARLSQRLINLHKPGVANRDLEDPLPCKVLAILVGVHGGLRLEVHVVTAHKEYC